MNSWTKSLKIGLSETYTTTVPLILYSNIKYLLQVQDGKSGRRIELYHYKYESYEEKQYENRLFCIFGICQFYRLFFGRSCHFCSAVFLFFLVCWSDNFGFVFLGFHKLGWSCYQKFVCFNVSVVYTFFLEMYTQGYE